MANAQLGVAVSHQDWVLQNLIMSWVRSDDPAREEYFGAGPVPAENTSPWRVDPDNYWGEAGVRRLVDRCVDRGAARLYWRVTNGGHTAYPSKVGQPCQTARQMASTPHPKWPPMALPRGVADFAAFDPLPHAVDQAHKRGAEIYAWFTGLEEDHGMAGRTSGLAAERPELCQENQWGEKLRGNLSLAFPEVLDYKRRLVREFLGYGFDGLLLDCSRENGFSRRWLTHCITRNGETRVPQGGFEAPVRQAFENAYGFDPRSLSGSGEWYEVWWKFKAQHYPTPLVRLCSDEARGRSIPIEALVHWRDNFETYGLDVENWVDEGLLDALCPIMRGLQYPGDTHAYQLDYTTHLDATYYRLKLMVRGRCKLRWCNYLYPISVILGYFGKRKHPIWGLAASPPPGPLAELVRGRWDLAQRVGADGFVAFEGNHLEAWGLWDCVP